MFLHQWPPYVGEVGQGKRGPHANTGFLAWIWRRVSKWDGPLQNDHHVFGSICAKSVLKTDGQLEYRACSLWLLMSLLEQDGVSPVLDVRLHVKSHVMSCPLSMPVLPEFHSARSSFLLYFPATSVTCRIPWRPQTVNLNHSLEPQVASGITKWQFLYRKNSFCKINGIISLDSFLMFNWK